MVLLSRSVTNEDMAEITNYYERGNTTNPKYAAFLLHGVGSNGQDLISLSPLWQPLLPDVVFISPDAPFACDMVPPGYPNSYQWFSLQNRERNAIEQGVKTAQPILEAFITERRQHYDIPLIKTALIGFSQGTMMSLYAAPRMKDKVAGVLGYSGALFGEKELTSEPDNFVKPPIHLVHGEADDVVPVAAFSHAKDNLTDAGFTVNGHTTPGLPHSIDEEGIRSGGRFLKEIFS